MKLNQEIISEIKGLILMSIFLLYSSISSFFLLYLAIIYRWYYFSLIHGCYITFNIAILIGCIQEIYQTIKHNKKVLKNE